MPRGAPTSSSKGPQCGYAACSAGKADMLNVHLVPHGHCDTGWLKTVDQYYYGSKNNIQNKGIQYNIDGVVQCLAEDPNRRFTWIEVAYFWRWWGEQTAARQDLVRQLVARGQLMFGNNAWEMNDEASANYQAIIDQHTLGERFLTETFGECGRPLTAWQIDTFGHSKEFASLLAQMGHDSLYFGRLDYQDKAKRMATKTMEMVWRGNDALGESSNLFTGALYNSYLPPPGFCYSCGDDPIMDDPRLFDYNVDEMVDKFIAAVNSWSKIYATNHILIPMGTDFDYELSNRWFVNQDKLIKYVNARQSRGSHINLLYSSVPCYTYAVNSVANHTFPEKEDDFFPYASRAHTFWTGTFTSRPTCKGYVRDSNAFLQTCKQLSVFSGLSGEKDIDAMIDHLRRGLAIDINHGQLPGTQRQIVAYDNMLRLSNGSLECLRAIGRSLDKLAPGSGSQAPFLCSLLNISQCQPLETTAKAVDVTVYNPLSRQVYHWLRLPSLTPHLSIRDAKGDLVKADVVPVTNRTSGIPERNSSAKYEALVKVELPPLGFTTLTVDAATNYAAAADIRESDGTDFSISNGILRLDFNGTSSLLMQITNLDNGGITTPASIDLRYYDSYEGNNVQSKDQASGAYIFRPTKQNATEFTNVKITSIVRGSQVSEVHQKFDSWATLITRLYAGSPFVELEWTVGPIPYGTPGHVGKEVIVNYQTGLKSEGLVYTDSSGRQMLRRRRNWRPTWNFTNTEPVSGNYYPLNTAIFVNDKSSQLTLLVDRAQGGGSITDGQIEIMVHRRTGDDDNFGVGQPLNELGADGKGLIARGRHLLLFNTTTASPALMRDLIGRVQSRPSVVVRPNGAGKVREWSGLRAGLPLNLQLLSLEGWTGGQVLMRLEHPFQPGEDKTWSQPAKVDLSAIFSNLKIASAEEMTLAGAMPLSQLKRLKWKSGSQKEDKKLKEGMNVILKPSEIRTFVVKLQ